MRTSTFKPEKLARFIKDEAKRLGFDMCRIAPASAGENAANNLAAFIKAGYHGTMEWMPETEARRADPKMLWPEVQSIIVLAMNYGPDEDPLSVHDKSDCGAISVYARNRDYHDVIKGKLKELAGKFAARVGAEVKVFVDTAPVMEKPLAQMAGLGWQGKHTNVVSRELGSWFFLGSIFTTADLPTDEAEIDHCGNCHACLDACPTDAFPAPHKIDARRCISYLTIEHKGQISKELRTRMGNRIYGCDDCLAACPWNKFARAVSEMKLAARDDLKEPALDFLLTLDDATFRTFFSGSPIKRIGRNRFIRNCLIAAANSGRLELAGHCKRLCHDEDAQVRAMALWAISVLEGVAGADLAAYLPPNEADPIVIAELRDLEN